MIDTGWLGSQKGLSIVTALFVLLVLSALGLFMVTMSGVQSRTFLWALQGARAYHAARSGLEWGGYRALKGGSCVSDSLDIDGFLVSVSCSEESFVEGGQSYKVFNVAALAESGTYGSRDYVSRQLQARITGAMP
ncbi:pilus assembly protein MshP [Syntrophotalea acetylenica]|jgi:MSHA biogenesis protein MshP|uniref:Pilus assembly protein MshP n=1 Tax=Syntrophotalea acetylenica TaxID=29542 RepID=A0A1L3GG64_SYNAC|nr:pilus assembly protein MshP [Syntrophotalea acetylenica]APG24964.1 pilus assembly protein MshP [Syntrophotalea acetylenica]APG43029.1 pilus assembly protein MshP [Syntrophotalea acetylenica]MDY0261058.1 pilus assembly protein MshP [Syntrophotalea acetylenica]